MAYIRLGVGPPLSAKRRGRKILDPGGLQCVATIRAPNFLASDPQVPRRKALREHRLQHCGRPEAARTPSFVSAFTTEVRAVARLNHPNVVEIHEMGTHEGEAFIAMEYVPGVQLRELREAAKETKGELVRLCPPEEDEEPGTCPCTGVAPEECPCGPPCCSL